MEKQKEPQFAPGQELTLHPKDPVKGAELLEEDAGEEKAGREVKPAANRGNLPWYSE